MKTDCCLLCRQASQKQVPWPVVLGCMAASPSISGNSVLVSGRQVLLGKSIDLSFKSPLAFEITLSSLRRNCKNKKMLQALHDQASSALNSGQTRTEPQTCLQKETSAGVRKDSHSFL